MNVCVKPANVGNSPRETPVLEIEQRTRMFSYSPSSAMYEMVFSKMSFETRGQNLFKMKCYHGQFPNFGSLTLVRNSGAESKKTSQDNLDGSVTQP